MRWLAAGVITGATLLLVVAGLQGSGRVSADNPPHKAGAGVTADSCAACHRAHTGQAAMLLKAAQPGLCYTCHGTGGTGSELDVQDGYFVTGRLALKGGGFDSALINTTDTGDQIGVFATATPPASSSSKHTNDGTAGTIWGNGAVNATPSAGVSFSLRCGSCHDPHGNGKYRVLRATPVAPGGSGVSVTDEATPVYSTTNYWAAYPTPVGGQLSEWCSDCHTRYLATAADSGETSSGDGIFTYRHRVQGTGGPSNVPPCIQCHVAHGTNAITTASGYSEGVEWPDDATPSGENSRLLKMDNRGICQKCHNK